MGAMKSGLTAARRSTIVSGRAASRVAGPLVAGAEAALVLDSHAAAEFAAPSGLFNSAIGDGFDGSAITRHEIDAVVRAILMQNRMVAMEAEP